MSSNAFHQLYYHFAWSVKDRKPVITDETRDWLIRYIETESRNRGGIVLACNAMPNHVHLFVTLPPTRCVATFIGQVKGVTTFAYNKQFPNTRLVWQEGYGVITVRKAESNRIVNYVVNQQTIHAQRKASRLLETTYLE